MALLLAGLASMAFGAADFIGGMATRRAPAVSVVVTSQLVGGLGILAAAFWFTPSWPTAANLAWGAGAGLAGGVGLVMLYHSLATVRIGVTVPVGALVGTALPVVFGVVVGERPAGTAWIGIVVGLVAVVLIARAPDDPATAAVPGGAIATAWGVAVGSAFGLFGILISRTPTESGLWPLVGARGASLALLVIGALLLRRPVLAEGVIGSAAGAGALDMVANVFFLVALRRGLLSVVAVIMAMYPATTIGLARIVLAERVGRTQLAGLAFGVLAMSLIAVG